MRVLRRAAAAALLALPWSPGPLTPRPSRAHRVVSPATVLVGGAVVVSGAATPALTGSSVVLQRANGEDVDHPCTQKPGAAGTFAFHVKAPKAAATWLLRVTRSSGGGNKAGVSATDRLHVVKTAFSVTAAATSPRTGTVVVAAQSAPRHRHSAAAATGPASWTSVATSTLSDAGAYSVRASLPTSPAMSCASPRRSRRPSPKGEQVAHRDAPGTRAGHRTDDAAQGRHRQGLHHHAVRDAGHKPVHLVRLRAADRHHPHPGGRARRHL